MQPVNNVNQNDWKTISSWRHVILYVLLSSTISGH